MTQKVAGIERAVNFLPLVRPAHPREDEPMFSVECPTHGTEVLLSERRIVGLRSSSEGHTLRWRCWCGTEGSTVLPGLPRPVQMVGRHRPAV